MHSHNLALVKSLVSVAWADGKYADEEREMVEALLAAFEADEEQARELREYAAVQRTLHDIPLEELSNDDCRLLIQHAVLLTYVDREQHEAERKILADLTELLRIPSEEASALISGAEQRAKRFLNLL